MRPIWFILGILLIAGVGIRTMITRRRQNHRLRQLAGRHRLNYSAEDLIGVHERYQNLEMVRRGHTRHASHIIFGATDAGMVTLFYYTYDLGFGANRADQYWWMVVFETAGQYDHCRIYPANPDVTGDNARKIDRFRIRADHKNTIDQLIGAGLERILRNAPADYQWEFRDSLIAIGKPDDSLPETPDRLLSTAYELAQLLGQG